MNSVSRFPALMRFTAAALLGCCLCAPSGSPPTDVALAAAEEQDNAAKKAAAELPKSTVARPAPRPLRLMLHGNMSAELPTEEYLQFVEQVKPDLLVMGVFDQRLYAACFPAADARRRADQPVKSPRELLDAWRQVADRLHRQGIRLVGQMELFTVSDRPADLSEKSGWFGFYDEAWDRDLLGERPTKTAAELLEEPDLDHELSLSTDGARPSGLTIARCGCRVNTKALAGCPNKPAWREVQKRMVQAALQIGVDGFLTNRNYAGHCGCDDCVRKFRNWLGTRYKPDELQSRFGIARIGEYPSSCVVGMHRDPETVPDEFVIEKQRFAKHMVKEFFDEVYGAAGERDSDLVLGQWNHMAYFDEFHLDRGHLPPSTRTSFAHGAADERWSLPADLWGRGENFFWYCNWGTSQNTMLEKQYAGDTVLYGKLLQRLARGKPYVINKYDFYRPQNMMAEAAAMGYATNAIFTPWQTDADRNVVQQYFDFLRTHSSLYDRAEPLAEVALLFPQRGLLAGDAAPLEYVEAAGRAMIANHVLFDILPDDRLAGVPLDSYRAIVVAAPEFMVPAERQLLADYAARGGKLIFTPVDPVDRERPGACGTLARKLAAAAAPFESASIEIVQLREQRERFLPALDRLLAAAGQPRSRFDVPWTVEVHAYRQRADNRIVLHLVNYNHQEGAKGASAIEREAPIAAEAGGVQLRVPAGFQCRSVRFLSPDGPPRAIDFTQEGDLLKFQSPGFLVYGVCEVSGN